MQAFMELVAANFVPAVIAFCVLVAMLLRAATIVITSIAAERSRREIAAYIAEGSLTPEQGERLLKAEVGRRGVC